MMNKQRFLNERGALNTRRCPSNRSLAELLPSLFSNANEQHGVYKGSVFAKYGQDLGPVRPRQPLSQSIRDVDTASPTQASFLHESTASHSEPRDADTLTTGSMMEMNSQVPRARLLVRPSTQQTQLVPMPSPQMEMPRNRINQQALTAAMAPTFSNAYTPLGVDPSYLMGCPSLSHIPMRHQYATAFAPTMPMGCHTDPREIVSDPFYLSSALSSPGFDVSRLGSLRYQRFGYPLQTPSYFEQDPQHNYWDGMSGYGSIMAQTTKTNSAYYPFHRFQDLLSSNQSMPLYSTNDSRLAQESLLHTPKDGLGVMIPTPRFLAGQTQYGGPIEALDTTKINSERSSKSRHLQPKSATTGLYNVSTDPVTNVKCPLMTASTLKSSKKGGGTKKTGVTKSKTVTKTKGKKKSSVTENKLAKREVEVTTSSSPVYKREVLTTAYDRIICQESEDGMSDASCLLYVPQLPDRMALPFDWIDNTRTRQDHVDVDDTVTEMLGLLENAGLEPMPMEDTIVSSSCPILPSTSNLAPSTADDVLELAFCCIGKASASAEELQDVMRSWIKLCNKGPSKNPGLELWRGFDLVKVFCNDQQGQEKIAMTLHQFKNRFQQSIVNANGQETWECITLGFNERFNAVAQTYDEQHLPGQQSRNQRGQKRKDASPPSVNKPPRVIQKQVSKSRRAGNASKIVYKAT